MLQPKTNFRAIVARLGQRTVDLVVIVLIWWLSHGWLAVLAAGLIAALTLIRYRSADGRDERLQVLIEAVVGLSFVVILVLTSSLTGRILVGIGFLTTPWWLAERGNATSHKLAVQTAAALFLGLVALFSAFDFWHWPAVIIVALAWLTSWLVAYRLLLKMEEKVAMVLAAAWALIVAEISWLFTSWSVSYVLPNSTLTIPQPAVVITALAYSLGGIYLSHRSNHLSRTRLVEYLLIGLAALSIVISGTNWRGAI